MILLLYSERKRIEIGITEIQSEMEPDFWNVLARKSDVINGWTYGCMRVRNTTKTRENFAKIESEYDSLTSYRIRSLTRFTNYVEDGDFFYIFNKAHVELAEQLTALEVLKQNRTNQLNWIMTHNHYFSLFSRLSFEFDVIAFGINGVEETIGELNKDLRTCRFCNKSGRERFRHVSHAIPEAIGNKQLFCAEECDECNEKLKEIEENFVHLMDFRRAMYKVRRKDKSYCTTVNGENYTISPDDEGNPILYIKQSTVTDGKSDKYHIKFNHTHPVVDQDIYRALVKIAIDLMPAEKLGYFKDTIKWIRGETDYPIHDALPSVLFKCLTNKDMHEQPMVYLLFRKSDSDNWPYCTALLHTTDVIYQYVIPYATNDIGRYKYDSELEIYRKKMEQYFGGDWEYQQYFSWWYSYIWNYWEVPRNQSNIHILPDSDSIFVQKKGLTDDEDKEYKYNMFEISDFSYKNLHINEERALIRRLAGQINPGERCIMTLAHFSISINIKNDTGNAFFKSKINLNKSTENLSTTIDFCITDMMRIINNPKFVTGDTFGNLIYNIWRMMSQEIDSRIGQKLGIANQFAFLSGITPYSIISHAIVDLIMPNGCIVKTSFKSLVE